MKIVKADEETDNDVLQAVGPAEVAPLVVAYQRAEAARDALRALLAALGVEITEHDVVATLNVRGAPCVRLVLRSRDDQERVARTLPALLRDH